MRICLVLGGGGAKGYVHVGVLRELIDRGYEIEAIVGTSIGALVGTLFAYNVTRLNGELSAHEKQQRASQAVETIFLDTNFQAFRDINYFSLLRKGVLKGKAIEEWLLTQTLSPHTKDGPVGIRFEQLRFPLTVVVTDALTGDSYELNRQYTPEMFVHRAVRASISIQGVFRDVTIDIDGRPIRAWDGGNTGNCRIDVARRLHPALPTVAVSLTYRGDPTSTDAALLTAWQRPKRLYDQALSILMRQFEKVVYEGLSVVDREKVIMLRPNLGSAQTFSFSIDRHERQVLIENGRAAVRKDVRWLNG